MFKNIFIILFCLISLNANSNESLLTIQQQLERLQREVSDLSQTVFSNQNTIAKEENRDVVTNLSAIDMRIYDLEKDVKNLNATLEDIYFQMEDLILKINTIQESTDSFEQKFIELKTQNSNVKTISNVNQDKTDGENTLGSLKITANNNLDQEVENKSEETLDTNQQKEEISPEDQFQIAFDNIRQKNWQEAKNSLKKFIQDNPENQLSGSAHYWLGELYILEKKFRDAALVLARRLSKIS